MIFLIVLFVNVKHHYALLEIIDNGVVTILYKDNVTWQHIGSVTEVLNVGNQFKVRVIEIDRKGQKIKVSKKGMEIDPFETFIVTHQVGEVLEGKVKQIKDFGAFIEVAPHVEGLLHVSELSWVKKIDHPKDILSKNQTIQVKIIALDKEKHKISLSYKETLSNPWESIKNLFSVGQLIEGTIQDINDFGI